jgi:asparagine synthase (glutamine-hydrolysing)
MCGIVGSFWSNSCTCNSPRNPSVHTRSIAHRGPDGASHVLIPPYGYLGFTQLSLVGESKQPFQSNSRSIVCNGEIFNYKQLQFLLPSHALGSRISSDCDVLLPGIAEWGFEECIKKLDGMFAIAMSVSLSEESQEVFIARDRFGIKPILWGLCEFGRCLAFSSEACGLPANWNISDVSPGHILHFRISINKTVELINNNRYITPWTVSPQVDPVCSSALRRSLISAVDSHLMGDYPVGVFLSGGVDSSIIASIAARLYQQRRKTLKTFSISHVADVSTIRNESKSLSTSSLSDLSFAQKTADFIQSDLTCFTFDTAEALSVLKDVIFQIESYDVGLVRVAVPLYLLSKKTASHGCRVVLVGEGADEVFGGYALFRAYSPHGDSNFDANAFKCELERRLTSISASELHRVDRCTMAFGVEARVPFLDASFLRIAMHDSCIKKKMSHPSSGIIEKYLLRNAFDGWLPNDVLYRRKEGMADGVGFQWINEVQLEATKLEKILDPHLAEAALYKRLFLESVHTSRAALAQSRIAYRNNNRPAKLSSIINGSAFVRGCKSVSNDPDLHNLFSKAEAVEFCSRVLGIDVTSRTPTLILLNSLIEAVLQRVPFHQFALLTRPRIPPTPKEVRDDWLNVVGGTCAYTSPAFAAMLSCLGFSVFLVAAVVHREFDHLALLVCVEGTFYYVDVGNGKRYFEAAPLGSQLPLGSPTSFQWRVQWNKIESRFQVIHGRYENGETSWDNRASIVFDPERLVHYSFFHDYFAQSRINPSNPFLHGLRFAIFPRLEQEISIKDSLVTFGSSRFKTSNQEDLVAFAEQYMTRLQFEWLLSALKTLSMQGDKLWPENDVG